jgi:hypothetical protein
MLGIEDDFARLVNIELEPDKDDPLGRLDWAYKHSVGSTPLMSPTATIRSSIYFDDLPDASVPTLTSGWNEEYDAERKRDGKEFALGAVIHYLRHCVTGEVTAEGATITYSQRLNYSLVFEAKRILAAHGWRLTEFGNYMVQIAPSRSEPDYIF